MRVLAQRLQFLPQAQQGSRRRASGSASAVHHQAAAFRLLVLVVLAATASGPATSLDGCRTSSACGRADRCELILSRCRRHELLQSLALLPKLRLAEPEQVLRMLLMLQQLLRLRSARGCTTRSTWSLHGRGRLATTCAALPACCWGQMRACPHGKYAARSGAYVTVEDSSSKAWSER